MDTKYKSFQSAEVKPPGQPVSAPKILFTPLTILLFSLGRVPSVTIIICLISPAMASVQLNPTHATCNTNLFANNPVKVLSPVCTTVILTWLQISALSRNIVRSLNSGVLNRNSLNGRNPIHDIARPWIKSLNSPPFHILLKQIWDLHTCQSISGLIFCHIHHL